MKKENVVSILNIWDPFGVIGLSPMDEYFDISDRVIELIESGENDENIKAYLISLYASKEDINLAKVNEVVKLLRKM